MCVCVVGQSKLGLSDVSIGTGITVSTGSRESSLLRCEVMAHEGGNEASSSGPPPVCCACARACALSTWYPALRHVSFRTELLPLTAAFLAYLGSDGILLPLPPADVDVPPLDPRRVGSGRSSSPSPPDDDDAGAPKPSFPELERSIVAALAALGGAVLPKLDWSAPLDATWAAPAGSLRCASAGEVFLLLKASDLVRYDCDLAARLAASEGPAGPPPHLALRSWLNLHPSGEFRCFVRHGRMVGISQRHTSLRFDFLLQGAALEEARAALLAFHAAELGKGGEDGRPERIPLAHYVFDAYIDRRARVWLVDLAPFGYDTSPLLFSWEELNGGRLTLACCEHAAGEEGGEGREAPALPPPIRAVTEDSPDVAFPPHAVHRYPDDLLELAAGGGGSEGPPRGAGLSQMLDWLEEVRLRQIEEDGSDFEQEEEEGAEDSSGRKKGAPRAGDGVPSSLLESLEAAGAESSHG